MTPDPKVLVWFRKDLRLSDNPALAQAIVTGLPVIPIYIRDVSGEGIWTEGAASRWWLHHSLTTLDASLREIGSKLIIASGESQDILLELCKKFDIVEVYWNRRYEPAVVKRDTEIKKELFANGIQARSYNGSLLQSPLNVASKAGTPFKVFTPFWNHIRNINTREIESRPTQISTPEKWPRSESIASLKLRSKVGWDAAFFNCWKPGEQGALEAFELFAGEKVKAYPKARDRPADQGVSRLSAHLHFGEISPAQIWKRLNLDTHEAYLRQLAWREFSNHLLFHFPNTPKEPLRPAFNEFPWSRDNAKLKRWQKGQTGYPIVDAGMRELWSTGWMHNRVRMIAASFLVKHLLIPWQEGSAWFWDTLVDADLANNTMGWQWVAGSGADASPYFRIFNPIAQGTRFDPKGEYTRKWLPELARMPDKFLFQPWEAPPSVLKEAGVALGKSYPKPIVNHPKARQAALDAYQQMKNAV